MEWDARGKIPHNHIIIDGGQDSVEGVDDHIQNIWIPLATMLFKLWVQIIFTTVTMPPYMIDKYRQLLGQSNFNIIRVSPDWPNVVFHPIPAYAEEFPRAVIITTRM